MTDLTAFTLAEARDLLRKREFSAVELTEAHLAAMKQAAALNAFVSYFALPVLFFGSLARAPVTAVLDPLLIAGLSLTVLATFGLGMLSTRLVGRTGLAAMSLQGIAASWGNVGYMGVPLCLAAFGERSLPPAMLSVIVISVFCMVIGVMLVELEVAAGHGP